MWFSFGQSSRAGALTTSFDVEPGRRLRVAEDLVVAVTPSKPRQIVSQGFWQIAHLFEFADRLGLRDVLRASDRRDHG